MPVTSRNQWQAAGLPLTTTTQLDSCEVCCVVAAIQCWANWNVLLCASDWAKFWG